jgi:phospholipid/cholesterol/gamma-HCH transport system substrate-binding protein
MTNRTNRATLTFTGLLLVTVAFLWWLMSLSGGAPRPGSTYNVHAVLPDAGAQLVGGARVTMSGVQVGTVTGVERRGSGAVISMEFTDESVTPIPSDSRAQLRSRTPLGENYISLLPGRSSRALPEDATIPLQQAEQTVDVDQVLSMLQGKSQENARKLIRGVGDAVGGRGKQLNVLTASAAGTLRSGSELVGRVYGQRKRIAQLVDQLGDVAAGVSARGEDIESIAGNGLETFRAVATQDDDLRRLARELPGTLRQVRSTTAKVSRTTDQAAPVLLDLAGTIDKARPAARALAPAATELRGVVAGLGRAATPLERTLKHLRAVAGPASTALPQVGQTLCQLNPILRYVRPYVSDVVAVMTHLGSASNAYDAIGHTIRLGATINKNSFVGMSAEQQAAANTLLKAGAATLSNRLTYDPYPKPNQANVLAKDLPQVDGPEQLRESGYRYPRVEADC